MVLRKLFFKIKRFLLKRITGLDPEDVKRLVYVQKYLDKRSRENNKTYNDYLMEHFKCQTVKQKNQ